MTHGTRQRPFCLWLQQPPRTDSRAAGTSVATCMQAQGLIRPSACNEVPAGWSAACAGLTFAALSADGNGVVVSVAACMRRRYNEALE